ncbi:YkgJ family cysteine cluster protein [Ancylobacter sp. Lp-2]|uniref:YkgJ family cysteine cluster protein n=1 Tax=Ancylobacter sp. Lp-2 TaxID=2881339 RepID=UPI001E4D467C|nr:YkgJ family cysteine cluster protein [Ancylobacter sp. Lp-2]MCB4767926.1 YkgJ family cysteine cluster protein [Ancylobacter sp. Lp-2]
MDIAAPSDPPFASPPRACGDCTLCCKVYTIPVLDKPEGQWCPHCTPGRGCGIYASRPDYCRAFHCEWLAAPRFPDHWKPTRSKMVVTRFPGNGFLYVQVDPGHPRAWSRQPYRGDLARWARQLLPRGAHVLVFVHDEATLIIGYQAIPLGRMSTEDSFRVRMRPTADGVKYVAERVPGPPKPPA